MTERSDQHEAYVDKARAHLHELDAQIEVFEAKAEKQAADARVDYGNALRELRDRRTELEARLKELQNASGDAWNDLRVGFESAVTNMRDSVKNAVARFR